MVIEPLYYKQRENQSERQSTSTWSVRKRCVTCAGNNRVTRTRVLVMVMVMVMVIMQFVCCCSASRATPSLIPSINSPHPPSPPHPQHHVLRTRRLTLDASMDVV